MIPCLHTFYGTFLFRQNNKRLRIGCLQSREKTSSIRDQSMMTQLHKSLRALGSFITEKSCGNRSCLCEPQTVSSQPAAQLVARSFEPTPELIRLAPELQMNNELFGGICFGPPATPESIPFSNPFVITWMRSASIYSTP